MVAAILLVFVVATVPAGAESGLKDPGIRHGERTTYAYFQGEDRTTITEIVRVKEEGGREIYEISSRTRAENSEVRISKNTMIPFYVHTVTRKHGLTLDNVTRVDGDVEAVDDEIILLSFTDLRYVLRGFPFDEPRHLKINLIESESDSRFEMGVKFLKIETLTIKSRKIKSYKLGLTTSGSGLMKVLSAMFPKIYFWYSVDPPHYLVRYEGSGGQMGSKSKIEIIGYSGWD